MNTFGRNFRLTTFGESHGEALGAVIDGCPAGLSLSVEDLQKELLRRRPGQSAVVSPRQEKDRAEILSGVFEGKTLGTPIAVIVRNHDARGKDYSHLKDVFRPGHADKVWQEKYGYRDYRGGGRASGRETIGRVIGGAIAKKFLEKLTATQIIAHTESLGGIRAEKCDLQEIERNAVRCADDVAAAAMIQRIEEAIKEKDSLGGIVRIEILNPPKSLGEPVFGKIEAELARALLSIGAVRSFEIGAGREVAETKGSESNKIKDGIAGGITTGDNIAIRLAVKPTPTIGKKQNAENRTGEIVEIEAQGRHDPCLLPRIIPVAEAMCALVLADFLLAPMSSLSD